MRKSICPNLITLLFLLVLAGLPALTTAAYADASQGLTWTAENTANFNAMAPGGPFPTAGNTSVDSISGSLIDVNGNNWRRDAFTSGTGTILVCPNGNPGTNYIGDGLLARPAGVAALNQRVISKNYMTAAGAQLAISLRANITAKQNYTILFNQSGVSALVLNNYPANAISTIAGLNGVAYSSPIPVGHYYTVDVSAVSNAGHTATTIAATVTDLGTSQAATTGTDLLNITSSPETTPYLQVSAGQLAMAGAYGNSQSLAFQTLNSGAVVPPALSASLPSLVSVLPSLGVIGTGAPSGGTPPYTAALYRSATPLFAPPTAGTLVSTQAGLAAGATPANVTDTGASGVSWYRWLFTDAAAATSTGATLPVSYPDSVLSALCIGDSRTQGAAGDLAFTDWCTPVGSTTPGTAYTTTPTIVVTNPGGFTGRTATYLPLMDGSGHVLGAYPVDRGRGYSSAVGGPTLSVTGGGGTGATFAAPATNISGIGGGNVLVAERVLQGIGGGFHKVTLWNGGLNGAHADAFLPGSVQLALALAMAGPPSACPRVYYDIGVNDAYALISKATFKANVLSTCQNLTGLGYKMTLAPPFFSQGATDAQNDLRLQYAAAMAEIAATDPVHIQVVKVNQDAEYTSDPAYLLADGLHANSYGHAMTGGNIALNLGYALSLIAAPAGPPLTLTVTAGVNSEVLAWTQDTGATNGYEVDWKPTSVLPVAGQVKSIVAVVGTGVLTWTDTSAYRLSQNGRYNVVALH